jgi:hypothetical protein
VHNEGNLRIFQLAEQGLGDFLITPRVPNRPKSVGIVRLWIRESGDVFGVIP